MPADSAATPLNRSDTCVFTENILFPKASAVISRDFSGNASAIDSIRSFLSSNDSGQFADIRIIGSHSPEGKDSFNETLAEARARALGRLVREIDPGINPDLSVSHPAAGQTGDYRSMRRAELQIRYRGSISGCRKPLPDTACRQVSPITPSYLNPCIIDTYIYIPPQDDSSSGRGGGQLCSRLFATTNMLYDLLLTPDIGVGMLIGSRATVLADWMYARWSNHERRRYWRIYGGDIEVRYRIGAPRKGSPLGGHHIGVYGSMACYDFQAGRSHTGVLSDTWNYAAGVSYTYTLPLSVHFNIDFSLGIGYLWGRYKKHIPIDDCDVWLSTHRMGWFGPTRAGVTLVWLIGNGVKNSRKGGSL